MTDDKSDDSSVLGNVNGDKRKCLTMLENMIDDGVFNVLENMTGNASNVSSVSEYVTDGKYTSLSVWEDVTDYK